MNKIIKLSDFVQTINSCKNKLNLQKSFVKLSVTAMVLNSFRCSVGKSGFMVVRTVSGLT